MSHLLVVFLSLSGRLFHDLGAKVLNALSPYEFWIWGCQWLCFVLRTSVNWQGCTQESEHYVEAPAVCFVHELVWVLVSVDQTCPGILMVVHGSTVQCTTHHETLHSGPHHSLSQEAPPGGVGVTVCSSSTQGFRGAHAGVFKVTTGIGLTFVKNRINTISKPGYLKYNRTCYVQCIGFNQNSPS